MHDATRDHRGREATISDLLELLAGAVAGVAHQVSGSALAAVLRTR